MGRKREEILLYNIILRNVENKYDFAELIKIFLRPEEFTLYTETELAEAEEQAETVENTSSEQIVFNEKLSTDKNEIKREIYNKLFSLTGKKPEWGILTGVRPVKLTGEIFENLMRASGENAETHKVQRMAEIASLTPQVEETLRTEYLLADEKIKLLIDTYTYQQECFGKPARNSVGLYIGIPFCPTRCLYCSFTSNQVGDAEIARYLEALKTEIQYVGRRMKETGLFAESIYMGGGTPTTLTAEQLDDLLTTVENNIDLTQIREFTVEAGRPETITYEKLRTIKSHNIERISINPQTMHQKTLEIIGRQHKPEDIIEAFERAKEVGIGIINADLITGLPGESPEDFAETLEKVMSLEPENITVHTLAVKRASRLVELDKDFHYKQAQTVKDMLGIAKQKLAENGFRPYYLYRQKHMAGAFENTGYCKEGAASLYNVRIMEEKQTIIALGAGGISKMYYPDENRLERVPNVSNYEIYISRLEEMLDRKEQKIFKEVN